MSHLLLYGLESVVGGGQTVAVWGQPGAGVGFDEREGGLVLLPGDLQQELETQRG